MYTSFFGFRENPFNLTPDPRYLYLSTYHKEALDHLLYGVKERKGFITITGGIGTGKTTLCRALLTHLDSSTKSALIFNSFISDMELLRTVNQEFGIRMAPGAVSKKDYIDALNHFLLDNFSRGWNAVLLIDEAQNLSHTVLEQIRMLSNLETEREKLIQIVLVGQSELKQLLGAPSLRQLDERIMVRYHLRTLDFKDIQGYVEHRLVVGGGKGNVHFTNSAFKKMYAYSRGNPRRINAVCDRALLIAYARERYTISKGIVGKAIRELHGDMWEDALVTDWSWNRFAAYALLLLFLIMLAGFAGWNLRGYLFGTPPVAQKAPAVRIVKPIGASPETVEPKKEPAPLFLEEDRSLSGLFNLFTTRVREKSPESSEAQFKLVSFNLKPEYYVMFKKPFRVQLSDSSSSPLRSPRYLLISEVTEGGAIAIDADGEEQSVSREFILNHWGPGLSWFYPHEDKKLYLRKGMEAPGVLQLQRRLNAIGYRVASTGVYDESTFQAVMKFQKEFRLKADGIAGPRTRALLFQMTN